MRFSSNPCNNGAILGDFGSAIQRASSTIASDIHKRKRKKNTCTNIGMKNMTSIIICIITGIICRTVIKGDIIV